MTYQKLDEITQYGGPNTFAQILGHIAFYCIKNNLPPLTSLIVNKGTGLPGKGLIAEIKVKELLSRREEVYEFNWYSISPPTVAELRSAWEEAEGV